MFFISMQIHVDNKINFSSRNKTIRFADDIVRKVNNEFPRISASRVDDFSSIKTKPYYRLNLWSRIERMRSYREYMFSKCNDVVKRFDCLIFPVKKHRLGNCSESAHLTTLVARLNGVKNCFPASLHSPEGFDFDHSVLYVNDEKPYVMDAWLGFADYLPEARLRYQKEFRKHFEFNLSDSENIIFPKSQSLYSDFLSQELSNEEMIVLKLLFPNLLIKK